MFTQIVQPAVNARYEENLSMHIRTQFNSGTACFLGDHLYLDVLIPPVPPH